MVLAPHWTMISSPAPPTDREDTGLLRHAPQAAPPSPTDASANRKIILSWEDLTYVVKTGGDEGSERTLLRHVSGYVQSGELLAVLGPSGAGKTTLLDLLAQRKTASHGQASGRILLNGAPVDSAAFRRMTGYVQQEDLFHTYVTVEEAVRFSATLRTPDTTSDDELERRVSRVLRQLGIDHVRYSCIGSATARAISGGERKRCAVAAEVVTSPSLLFLDEPTTGLDTFTALHLMTLLRSLARSNVAVVVSIHQPRSRIYEVFDRILLLNGLGEEAFFGPASDALGFLAEIGLSTPLSTNPADYLIDAVSVLSVEEGTWLAQQQRPSAGETSVGVDQEGFATASEASKERRDGTVSVTPTQGRDIAAAFASLRLPGVLIRMQTLQLSHRAAVASLPEMNDPAGSYYRSWGTQVRCIAMRYLRNRRRDPIATYVLISSAIVFAFLTGSVYYQLGDSQDSIRSRMGVLFFIMMICTFSSLGSLEMFLTDRAIYAREHRNGMYCTSAYYVGKIIQDIPIAVVVNFSFNVIVYFLVGLQLSLVKFLVFSGVGALTMLNGYALCLLTSNMATDYSSANILTSLLLVLYLLPTGGMLVSLNSIPLLWRWIKYISFVRYAFSALVANEFDGLVLTCDATPPTLLPCITSGTAYAASQGMLADDISRHVVYVTISVTVYLLLGYLVLRCWRSAEGK